MLDPLVFRLLAMVFALLFITAGVHKLGNRLHFQGILSAYQIVPVSLVGLVSWILPLAEIAVGFGWILAWQIEIVALATAGMLAMYALAMGINLKRGRTYIDCGCGFGSVKAGRTDSSVQQLSVWLVYRNLLLVMLALVGSTGMAERAIGVLDYVSLAAATVALVMLYTAFNQLLVNHNAIDSWRKPLRVKQAAGGRHD